MRTAEELGKLVHAKFYGPDCWDGLPEWVRREYGEIGQTLYDLALEDAAMDLDTNHQMAWAQNVRSLKSKGGA